MTEAELRAIADAKRKLDPSKHDELDMRMATMRKDPNTALILSIFFGGLGVDRFYIGDAGLGVGKLLTLGGLGVWALVDWFIIRGAAEAKNLQAVRTIASTLE